MNHSLPSANKPVFPDGYKPTTPPNATPADAPDKLSPVSPKSPGTTHLAQETLAGSSQVTASKEIHASNITPLLGETEEQAIKNRDGFMWECVKRIPADEGFVYRFSFRDKYDPAKEVFDQEAFEVLVNDIYPAIEYNGEMLRTKMAGEAEKLTTVLSELGYKYETTKDKVFVEFPDKEVLDARWKMFKEKHPDWNLPDLTILSSEGIATDDEFLNAFFTCDVVLATGREFTHDQCVHVLHTIEFMVLEPEKYAKAREAMRDSVKNLLQGIEKVRNLVETRPEDVKKALQRNVKGLDLEHFKKNLEHANIIPAILADQYAAAPGSGSVKIFDNFKVLTPLVDIEYEEFLQKRFSNDPDIDIPSLCYSLDALLNDPALA